MGLPRIQFLPSDGQYYSERIESPVTFFSTLETTVNSEGDMYDIIQLEELEVGMVTEVSTTAENEYTAAEGLDNAEADSAVVAKQSDAETDAEVCVHPMVLPVAVDFEFTGSENETETCDLENQTYSEDDSSFMADISSETIIPYTCTEQNNGKLGSISDNCNENLNINSENLNELVAEICSDDLVFAWLSSLNENSVTSTTDFESLSVPTVEKNDVGLAKEELRSFLLARKTKSSVAEELESSEPFRHYRARDDDVKRTYKKPKLADSNPEELVRHRRRQECNRIAARKCRQKRTKLAEELTNESEKLRKHNEKLTSEVRDLTSELRKLENFVLDHDLHMSSYQCHEHMSTLLLSQLLPELP